MKRLCCLLFFFALFCCASARRDFAQKARHAAPKIEYLDPSRGPLTGAIYDRRAYHEMKLIWIKESGAFVKGEKMRHVDPR